MISEQNFSVQGPFPQVSLQAPRGFWNGMTVAIGPKNEASTLKSLKLAKIKDFTK